MTEKREISPAVKLIMMFLIMITLANAGLLYFDSMAVDTNKRIIADYNSLETYCFERQDVVAQREAREAFDRLKLEEIFEKENN